MKLPMDHTISIQDLQELGLYAKFLRILGEYAIPTPKEEDKIIQEGVALTKNTVRANEQLAPLIDQHGLMSIIVLKEINLLQETKVLYAGLYPSLIDLKDEALDLIEKRNIRNKRKAQREVRQQRREELGAAAAPPGAKRGRKYKQTRFGDQWPVPFNTVWTWGMGQEFHQLLVRKPYTYWELFDIAKKRKRNLNEQALQRYWRFYCGEAGRKVGWAIKPVDNPEIPKPGELPKNIKVQIVPLPESEKERWHGG